MQTAPVAQEKNISSVMVKSPDIVIFGAGIAGLWTFHRLKRMGYDALLLEKDSIGCGQTIASQGIIHSGLKFSLMGKVSTLAKTISAMPDIWRKVLNGEGSINLSTAKVQANSQLLLIPHGLVGGITKLVAQKTLGGGVHEIPKKDWSEPLQNSGFQGSVIFMGEPVLNIPSVLHGLAEPYKDCIRKISQEDSLTPFNFLETHNIKPKKIIFTAARSNHLIAKTAHHDKGLETQERPLLQGMMKPAPFPLFAHLVGKTDKPVATITTHTGQDGSLIWYLGASLAERPKESNPQEIIDSAKKTFISYFPALNFSDVQWATLPIDRIEGKTKTGGWMPDIPTIHRADNILYCWPTKLTFAPLLADMIIEEIKKDGLSPMHTKTDFTFLPPVDYAIAPWDKTKWIK